MSHSFLALLCGCVLMGGWEAAGEDGAAPEGKATTSGVSAI